MKDVNIDLVFLLWCLSWRDRGLPSILRVTERKSAFFEDEETDLFIEVDCFNVEPVLGPAPEGLSQQQVPSMHSERPPVAYVQMLVG